MSKQLNLPDKAELARKLKISNVLQISKEYNTYVNKIRRLAIKYGLELPTASVVQKRLVAAGKVPHNKGKKLSAATKEKISEKVAETWTDERRQLQKEISRELWEKQSDKFHEKRKKACYRALREASDKGSKLERYLVSKLIEAGYEVEHHAESRLENERLQIDILIKNKKIAIEVNGPAHREKIWSDQEYKRVKKADKIKAGLLLQRGFKLLKVKSGQGKSQAYFRNAANLVLEKLDKMIKGQTNPIEEVDCG